MRMRAIYADTVNRDDPLAGLAIGDIAPPEPPPDWIPIRVKAAALNHHDLWALRGVALKPEQLPMILGTDAVGIDPNGREVIVHAVIGDAERYGDETLDPARSLLSEQYPGTLAETVWVPARDCVPKPPGLPSTDAACLPTSWLTAWRMLTTRGGLRADSKDAVVLVQGAGGGVATAAMVLAQALGAKVYVTSRDAGRRERASELGAHPLEPGARMPERADVVVETVGEATLAHSIKSTRPGGRVVIAGATSGFTANVDLRHVYFRQIQLLGSTMGTVDELQALIAFCVETGIRPVIDSTFTFDDARDAFGRLESGSAFGKVVILI